MNFSPVKVCCVGHHPSLNAVAALNSSSLLVQQVEQVEMGLPVELEKQNFDLVIIQTSNRLQWQTMLPGLIRFPNIAIINAAPEIATSDIYQAGVNVVFPFDISEKAVIDWVTLQTTRLQEARRLQLDSQMATQTATIAMTNSSELGRVIQFIENSYELKTGFALAKGVFQLLNSLELKSSLVFRWQDGAVDYFTCERGSVPETERNILSQFSSSGRIIDFSCRTLVNFPKVSMLVKNMPIEDEQKYGRLKDLMPSILGAVNTKLELLDQEKLMYSNACDTILAFNQFRTALFKLAKAQNEHNTAALNDLIDMKTRIFDSLPTLGLDDDQERFIETALDDALEKVALSFQESSTHTAGLLLTVEDVKTLSNRLEDISQSLAPTPEELAMPSMDDFVTDDIDETDDIELF
ncbi:MAG: hypothetical protein GJ680_09125 [Alteromonadaceae bacterium]|nr:hypothetical protein [Alteromonadaceae bacterium]